MSSVDYLDYWLNKRLRIIKKEIDLHPYPFTLRHLDFSRRNIKLTGAITKGLTATTQYVCLIGALGFYSRCFELTSASCINDGDFAYKLYLVQAINDIMRPTEQEKIDVDLLKEPVLVVYDIPCELVVKHRGERAAHAPGKHRARTVSHRGGR